MLEWKTRSATTNTNWGTQWCHKEVEQWQTSEMNWVPLWEDRELRANEHQPWVTHPQMFDSCYSDMQMSHMQNIIIFQCLFIKKAVSQMKMMDFFQMYLWLLCSLYVVFGLINATRR